MSRVQWCTGSVLVAVVWAGVAAGRWASPVYLPADQLIKNAAAYVQEHPADASAYYVLARIHYLAFVNKAFLVAVFGNYTPPHPIPYWWWGDYLWRMRRAEAERLALEEYGRQSTGDVPAADQTAFWARVSAIETRLESENWRPEQPGVDELVQHAGAAQWNFCRAIATDPNNALYYLGLASLEEQYLEFFGNSSTAPMPASLKTIAVAAVKDIYLLSYNLSIQEDLQLQHLPLEGIRGIISYEAGSAYIRLWEAEESIPAEVQARIDEMKANLAKMAALPIGAITPIVFSMQDSLSLAELLASERIVRFDLDGDGIVERRPWVKPTTGLLVWDADGDGKIASGRELFGSVTWWLFFMNGYRAMDLLDDNRDGLLTAGELKGIAVWFDKNCDGRTDRGEVVSLDSLGIEAIGTRPTGRDGVCPMHSSGIRLKDGRTLPSYDWIAPAVRDK
ncbi:MAG: hypothetical protein KBE65_13050 [Phycisphaerae bacterium]|nr:hypothetical protein [Phycisphaerae bacterium]